MKKAVAFSLTGIVVFICTGLVFVYGGLINVAADEPPFESTKWLLHTTMVNSVKMRADSLKEPMLDSQTLAKGASSYQSMCASCHGAPGLEPQPLAAGLHPRPPRFVRRSEEWSTAEIFWLVKHGIKMTGMPAFGPTHNDEALWPIAQLVKSLPHMSAEEYQSLLADARTSGHAHDHQGHLHGADQHNAPAKSGNAVAPSSLEKSRTPDTLRSSEQGVSPDERHKGPDEHDHGDHPHD